MVDGRGLRDIAVTHCVAIRTAVRNACQLPRSVSEAVERSREPKRGRNVPALQLEYVCTETSITEVQ